MSMGIPNGANLVSEYVSVFVKLLDSPHNAIQNSSASVISNLCKGLPCHRQSVFSAGAIKSLIVLLADADTLENAIRAIANASYFYKHTEIQELVDAGVIGTMVKSLDSPFRLLASVILSNISAGGAKQSLIAEGAIPAMIKAFDYSDPEICFFLFSGLKNLITGNEKQRLFVVQNGVIHCLIKLLKFRASVEGALYALTIIANGTKDEKEILVNAGAVKVFLFSMLSSSEEKSIKEAASDISLSYNLEKNNAEIMNYLSSLDSNSRDRISNALVDIIEGNIEQEEAIIESIPYLVKLLDDKQLCEYAARAIKSLIKGTMIGLEKTVQQGVVSFLIKSFAVKNVNASKYAAEALKFMLTNELAHDMIMIQILADLKNELENILRTSSTEFEKICRKLVAYDFITVIQDLKDKENAVIKNHASTLLQLVDEIYVQKLGKTLLRRCPSLEAEINATNYTNAQFIPTSELPRGLVQMLRRCFAER
uniref:Uncharacterized protein n=1 Tax=Panagrolaimus davidi TaxID=227884 RepID=A0A914Q0Q4_9BILA